MFEWMDVSGGAVLNLTQGPVSVARSQQLVVGPVANDDAVVEHNDARDKINKRLTENV